MPADFLNKSATSGLSSEAGASPPGKGAWTLAKETPPRCEHSSLCSLLTV